VAVATHRNISCNVRYVLSVGQCEAILGRLFGEVFSAEPLGPTKEGIERISKQFILELKTYTTNN
jgi:hypothetical protein